MMAGGGGGEAAAPGRDWESSSPPALNGEAGVSGHHHPPRHVVSDEMLYKLSKKIAQLTKVLHTTSKNVFWFFILWFTVQYLQVS